jgi:transketolase
VATVEEGVKIGGFGSAVADLLIEQMGAALPPLGLPDEFPHNYGLQEDLLDIYGLMPAQIAAQIAKHATKKAKVA